MTSSNSTFPLPIPFVSRAVHVQVGAQPPQDLAELLTLYEKVIIGPGHT